MRGSSPFGLYGNLGPPPESFEFFGRWRGEVLERCIRMIALLNQELDCPPMIEDFLDWWLSQDLETQEEIVKCSIFLMSTSFFQAAPLSL